MLGPPQKHQTDGSFAELAMQSCTDPRFYFPYSFWRSLKAFDQQVATLDSESSERTDTIIPSDGSGCPKWGYSLLQFSRSCWNNQSKIPKLVAGVAELFLMPNALWAKTKVTTDDAADASLATLALIRGQSAMLLTVAITFAILFILAITFAIILNFHHHQLLAPSGALWSS